jgi:phosphate-selective porin OprO and OprP
VSQNPGSGIFLLPVRRPLVIDRRLAHPLSSIAGIVLMMALCARADAQPSSAPAPASRPARETKSEPRPWVPRKPERIIQPALQPAATTPAPLKKGFRLEGVYDEGFGLRTPDAATELKLGASAQLDSRFYAGSSTAPNSFDIRRARIDFQAKFWNRLQIRIQAAMEDGTPYIRNAFADLKLWSWLHIRGGQMKVPFSSSWLAFDNQVDFMERATAEPLYPFFDRGAMVWGTLLGERITYTLGIFTGAGVDLDYPKGDQDNNKDIAWRLFLQPFRKSPVTFLDRLYIAGNGTWGYGTAATKRFETRGLVAADYESQVWRFRGDQMLGTNGRNTDQLSASFGSRTRWGAELHYLVGPVTFSAEWVYVGYEKFRVFHDFMQGSKILRHDCVLPSTCSPGSGADGGIHNLSFFLSWFITGETKFLDTWGWRQPTPNRPLFWGGRKNGPGAWEVLGRFSATFTDKALLADPNNPVKVKGFAAATDFTDPSNKLAGPAPGEGSSVTAAIFEGASTLYEMTFGVNWTMNYHLRLMLDYTFLYAGDWDKYNGAYGVISAGNSEQTDPNRKSRQVHSEHNVGLRLILRI